MVPWLATERAWAECFRREAYHTVEYSFEPDAARIGWMVGGDARFSSAARRFMGAIGVGGSWFWAIERFVAFTRPDTYLFKVDRDREILSAVTLYCRFPRPVSQEQLQETLNACPPLAWNGPSIDRLSRALDVGAPRGIGFRLTGGATGAAVYFRAAAGFRRFTTRQLHALLDVCDFDPGMSAAIAAEAGGFYASGPMGVIGFEAPSDSSPGTLKLDPANVPFSKVTKALTEWETADGYVRQIERVAASLRATTASYLGLKFSPGGFAGWKLYLAVKPAEVPAAGTPRLIGPREISPSFRLPHY